MVMGYVFVGLDTRISLQAKCELFDYLGSEQVRNSAVLINNVASRIQPHVFARCIQEGISGNSSRSVTPWNPLRKEKTSIERELTDFEFVVDKFATLKARRIKL